MVIPAGVVGLGDRVHVGIQRARLRAAGGRPTRRPPPCASWSRACSQRGQRLHVAHLGAVAPVARDLVDEVPGDDRRVQLGSAITAVRACASASASSRGVLEYQLPAPSTGPTPCHTRIPAASSRSSRPGSSGCWARAALAPIAFSSLHDLALVVGRQRVAVAHRVLLDRRAVQLQSLPVEVHAPAVPGQLAQAHARRVAALLADGERQLVEVRAARRPQRRFFDAHGRGRERALARRERQAGEVQRDRLRAVRERAFRCDRARRPVVSHLRRRPSRSRAWRSVRRARASFAIVGLDSSLGPISRMSTSPSRPPQLNQVR